MADVLLQAVKAFGIPDQIPSLDATSANPPRNSSAAAACVIPRGSIAAKDQLMERFNRVLFHGMIDTGLSTHAGIHHRQQRCGNLNQRQSPEQRRGDEAGHVGNDAAPQANDRNAPVQSMAQQAVVDKNFKSSPRM